MLFSEYAEGLQPFLFPSFDAEYFTALIGHYIIQSTQDACPLLTYKPDTQQRYLRGQRISTKNCAFLYQNKDERSFATWISQCMIDNQSTDDVESWLDSHQVVHDDQIDVACTQLLTSIFKEGSSNGKSSHFKSTSDFSADIDLINEIEKKIQQLPRPQNVPVPAQAQPEEEKYIQELYAAYGDKEGLSSFSDAELESYPLYKDDLADRRIDFYAAESIKRSVLELNGDELSEQFQKLKTETRNGVIDTQRKSYPNGYERMLAVMEQAVNLSPTGYLLSTSPYWINANIKKGTCHHLVNEGRLKWVV